MTEENKQSIEEDLISFADFLESHPPNQFARIEQVWTQRNNDSQRFIITPEIRLHCSNESCNGTRYFRCTSRPPLVQEGEFVNTYLTYLCSNCQRTEKVFSVAVRMDQHNSDYLETGDCLKFGELPAFGRPERCGQ